MFEIPTTHLSIGTNSEAEGGVCCWWPQLVPEEVIEHLVTTLELVGLVPVVLHGHMHPLDSPGDDRREVICVCKILPEHRVVQGVLRG